MPDARVQVQKPLQGRRLPRPPLRTARPRFEVRVGALLPRRRRESAGERAARERESANEAHELRKEQAEDDTAVRSEVHRPRVSLSFVYV